MRSGSNLETVDEFETRKEAVSMLTEYNMAAGIGWHYYLSTRPCRGWSKEEE